MRCTRCGGLMVFEEFEDFALGSGGDGFWGQRCINCGAIVDLVIAAHRRSRREEWHPHSALTTIQRRFVMHVWRVGGAATLPGVSR